MIQIYVKPNAGRAVRHPDTKMLLPPEGGWFPNNAATRRLINKRDLIEATAPGAVIPEPEKEDVSPTVTVDPLAKINAMIAAGRAQLETDETEAQAVAESAVDMPATTGNTKSRKKRSQ